MRSLATAALLVALTALLTANLVVSFRSPSLPLLSAQSAGGESVVLSAVPQTGGEALVFVYDQETRTLAQYRGRSSGLQLTGVRRLEYDLKVIDWPGKLAPSVKEVRDTVLKKQNAGSP